MHNLKFQESERRTQKRKALIVGFPEGRIERSSSQNECGSKFAETLN
jgi:hypothetical protein